MDTAYQAQRRKLKAMQIGELCKYYREQEKLPLRQIANKAGYLPQTVYAFESGKSNATILLFDCYFNQLDEQHQQDLYKAIKGVLNNE